MIYDVANRQISLFFVRISLSALSQRAQKKKMSLLPDGSIFVH